MKQAAAAHDTATIALTQPTRYGIRHGSNGSIVNARAAAALT
ncbi:hypothetical protein ACQEU8_19815 [Streptomyces sp. CA-250714]